MLIDEYRGRLPVARMCTLLGISRGAYYHFKRRGEPGGRGTVDPSLMDEIRRIKKAFPSYGYRRVVAALKKRGIVVNHKRVLRLMREAHLLARMKRRYTRTTDFKARSACLSQSG